MKKKVILSANPNAADTARMKMGIEKTETIMRLVHEAFGFPYKDLDNNVYIEDGELNVCVRVYREIDDKVKHFIRDLMDLAGLTSIEDFDCDIDEKDTTFFSVLKA